MNPLRTQQIVPHAADRCAVILVPAFWGNSPRNKDKGRLLFILYFDMYSLVLTLRRPDLYSIANLLLISFLHLLKISNLLDTLKQT